MTAMNSLSVRLQTLIRESLHTTKTGCVVVHSECLNQLWSAITKVYPVPSWKRFAAFVASTGGKFEVNEPGTRHVEYKAHIILMIFLNVACTLTQRTSIDSCEHGSKPKQRLLGLALRPLNLMRF